MKLLVSLFLTIFLSIPCFCQFQKEAEYPASRVTRILLQDQSERYLYYHVESSQIIIANESHELIDSLPAPDCEGTFTILNARNDFEETPLGILCNCLTSSANGLSYDYFFLDSDGNTMLDLSTYSFMDERYIIDNDLDDFQSTIYDTQSMEVNSVKPQMQIIQSNPNYNDGIYYFAYNGIDSIFVLDESLTTIRSVPSEFVDSSNRINFSAASIIEDGQTQFYFQISEVDQTSTEEIYNKLIDEDGSTILELGNGFNIFYKFEQNLNVLNIVQQELISYSIRDNAFSTAPSPFGGITSVNSSGKYPFVNYTESTGLAAFYDSNLELTNEVQLDMNLSAVPFVFYDQDGTEYFWYNPFIPSINNSTIYKENTFLQRIDDSRRISVSNIENLPTKLFSASSLEDELTEVYSMMTTSTYDIDPTSFSLSPNPVSDELRVSTKQKYDSYIVIDNTGKVVLHKFLDTNDFEIDVNQLKAGLYFLKLQSSNNQTEPKKFIKIE